MYDYALLCKATASTAETPLVTSYLYLILTKSGPKCIYPSCKVTIILKKVVYTSEVSIFKIILCSSFAFSTT